MLPEDSARFGGFSEEPSLEPPRRFEVNYGGCDRAAL
jgi:hypothetical protein